MQKRHGNNDFNTITREIYDNIIKNTITNNINFKNVKEETTKSTATISTILTRKIKKAIAVIVQDKK